MMFNAKRLEYQTKTVQYGKESVQLMYFLHKTGLHVPTKLINQNTLSAIFKTSKCSRKNIKG